MASRGRGFCALVAFVAGITALIVSGNALVFGQEFSNFGHPNLILFSGNDVSPTAGTITNTIAGGNGRQIQLALRLEF